MMTLDFENMTPENIIDIAYELNFARDNKHRLYHCTAWVYEIGNVVYLESYCTIVAYFYKPNNTLYINGRYSMTTYHHCRKFRNYCWENYCSPIECKPWDIKEVNLERVNWFK